MQEIYVAKLKWLCITKYPQIKRVQYLLEGSVTNFQKAVSNQSATAIDEKANKIISYKNDNISK